MQNEKGEITKGSSELEGSYGGFQPKPAVEVVLVAMKPIEEKGLLAQAEKNGKAVSWFDDCRIPFKEEIRHKVVMVLWILVLENQLKHKIMRKIKKLPKKQKII